MPAFAQNWKKSSIILQWLYEKSRRYIHSWISKGIRIYKYRNFFLENIPSYLKIDGDNSCLYTKKGSLVCRRYNRIVIGDYGAFVEFSKEDVGEDFPIKDGQEYRIFDRKYSKNVKYLWYTINDGSDIKIYYQKRKVDYL